MTPFIDFRSFNIVENLSNWELQKIEDKTGENLSTDFKSLVRREKPKPSESGDESSMPTTFMGNRESLVVSW